MKLRYWQQPDLPAPTRMIPVSHADWLAALAGGRAAATQVIWRLAGHRTMTGDWSNGPRRLNEHLIYFISDGGPLRLDLEQRQVLLKPGTLMWLAPDVQHRLGPVAPHSPATLYHMRFRVRRDDGDLYLKPVEAVIQQAPNVNWEMEQIVSELLSQNDGVEMRCRALLTSLSVTVFRLLDHTAATNPAFSGTQIGRLLEFARTHTAQWPRPSDLARQVNLSPGYFSRIFRKHFGRSARKWLCEQRIHEAARLLVESNLNVNQVADHLGYRDVFLFSRQFKQVTGLSPTTYRKSF